MARTQPMLLFVFIATYYVVSIAASKDNNSSHSQPERGMARLLGKEGSETFVTSVWGGDQPYFIPASSSFDATDLLWSKALSENYLKNGDKPWAFEKGKR